MPDKDKWTLILVSELRHSPEKVWQAPTDPAHLREWVPFEADSNLGRAGSTVKLTWVGTPTPMETRVMRADAPKVLEYGDTRRELEALDGGTRLTLWHNIDRRFISWVPRAGTLLSMFWIGCSTEFPSVAWLVQTR